MTVVVDTSCETKVDEAALLLPTGFGFHIARKLA